MERLKYKLASILLILGALSIEVYGHRRSGSEFCKALMEEEQEAKARSLADRWAELTRQLQVSVEVQELNDSGFYAPVEVQPNAEVSAVSGY